MSEATLTTKGRVTVPRDIRQKLGWVAGDKLAFHLCSDGATVIRAKTPAQRHGECAGATGSEKANAER